MNTVFWNFNASTQNQGMRVLKATADFNGRVVYRLHLFRRGRARNVVCCRYIYYAPFYLGVKLNYNGNYKKMIAKQITQARKALYCIARKLQLPIDIQCQLFDHLVLPILLYGSEIWGYEDLLQVEVFHRKFLRLILHVNRCTPDCMIYGETCRGAILTNVEWSVFGVD